MRPAGRRYTPSVVSASDGILVTGGAGFVGATLVRRLVASGYRVRVLDNLSTGTLANLEDAAEQVELVDGDITDLATVRTAMRDVEVVFHQAALPSVPRSIADPVATHDACVNGTLNVLLAARDEGVRRVVTELRTVGRRRWRPVRGSRGAKSRRQSRPPPG